MAYRNAQATGASRRPARSASLMDCDTTGIEPDFALVKFKKLAGGGYFKIINRVVPVALRAPWLRRRRRCEHHRATVVGHGTLEGCARHHVTTR
jgi:ribonucleoside-diphosphate reductase alpha chain